MCVTDTQLLQRAVAVSFSTMARRGNAEARWGFSLTSVILIICLSPVTEAYKLRKATGRNRGSMLNYKEGTILFGNFFEKMETGLPTSEHANGVVASSVKDSIGYQADSAGRH